MKLKAWHLYLLVFLANTLIALIAFGDVLFSEGKLIFCNFGDGLKNYFTLYTYVKPSAGDLLKYNGFSYPFGDYVYFTDNTPLFSIPYKWFCQNIVNISTHVFTIYNATVVANIVLCGLLVLYVLRYLVKDNTIAVLMACILPWINIQVPRIWRGHYNLSFSSLILLAICLMILWYENRYHIKRMLMIGICMILLCFCSFLAHGYYLAIIGIFMAAMLFFYSLFSRERKPGIISFIASGLIPLISVGLALALARYTDGYLALRTEGAKGYDWMDHKVRLSALFTPYTLHKFHFPIQSWFDGNDERAAYLGNIFLYGTAVLIIAALSNKTFRSRVKAIVNDFFRDSLKAALFTAAMLMLVIAMGERYYFGDKQLMVFYNVFNPLFYLHKFTKYVEQFRSLGRFGWPVFYAFNFLLLFVLVQLGRQHYSKVRALTIGVILLLGGIEVQNFVAEIRRSAVMSNPLHPAAHTDLQKLKIDFGKYQAILPLPYYTVGTEVYEYTLDDRDDWSNFSYRLSAHGNLPLMSVKLSRTPLDHTISILDLATIDGGLLKEEMHALLNDKPVLVAFNRQTIVADTPRYEPAKTYFFRLSTFVERNGRPPVDSLGEIMFYEWYPKSRMKL